MTDILLLNKSRLLTTADFAPVVPALNKQIADDFSPFWGTPGTVHFGDAPAGAWQFTLQDTISDPDALGYHVDDDGTVSAIIDVEACKTSGGDWRTCLGHEVLEALADPLTSRMGEGSFAPYIVEVADPVEEDTYEIDGVTVTNFVTPAYFGFNADTRYDKMGLLKSPAPTLRPGGYYMALENGQWTNHFGEHRGFMATRTNGRRAWRVRVSA